jgi:hypothetical protein
VRLAIKATGQGGQVRRDKRYGLRGKAAERALIVAMAGRRVLNRSLVVVDLDAELGGIAKERLKLGSNRRVVGAGESGRGHRGRRRGGEKLNDERERDKKRGPGRAPLDRAPSPSPRPKRKFPAAEAHQNIPPICLFGNRRREGTQFIVVPEKRARTTMGEVSFDHFMF